VDNLLVEGCIFNDGGLTEAKDNAAGGQLTTTNRVSTFRNNLFIKINSLGGGMLTTGATGNLIISNNAFVDLSGNSYAAVSIENSYGACKNIQVIGNYAYGIGFAVGQILTYTLGHVQIIGNIVEGTGPTGIGTGIIRGIGKMVTIKDNQITNTVYGIHAAVPAGGGEIVVANNLIKNTNITSATSIFDKGGIYLAANTETAVAKISGNIITDDSGTTPHGIRTGNSPNMRLYLEGNVFQGPFANEAIYITSTLGFLYMVENNINGTVLLGTITDKTIKRNYGYTTENSGTATIVAGNSYVDVPHGLSIKPKLEKIGLTFQTDLEGRDVWVSNATSSTFRINLSSVDTKDNIIGWRYSE